MEDIIKNEEQSSSAKATAGRRKTILAIIILAVILIGGAFLGWKLISEENTWVCESGKWVKHGNPNTPMPTDPCKKTAVSTGQPIKPTENPARKDPLDEKLGYGCGGPGSFKPETVKAPDSTWTIKKDGSETSVSLGKYKLPLAERTIIDLNKIWFYFLSDTLSTRDDKWYGLEASYVSGMVLSVNGYEESVSLGGNEYMFMELTNFPLGDWYPYVQERYAEFEIIVKLKCKNIQDGKCLDNKGKALDYVDNADIKSNIRLFATGCEPFTVDIATDAKIKYE